MSTIPLIPWFPIYNIITAITQANPAVITTATNHNYDNGLYIRVVMNGNFGMGGLDNNVYLINVLTPTTFSINANTINQDPFAVGSNKQSPQVIPVGEVALTLNNAEFNLLTPVGG